MSSFTLSFSFQDILILINSSMRGRGYPFLPSSVKVAIRCLSVSMDKSKTEINRSLTKSLCDIYHFYKF